MPINWNQLCLISVLLLIGTSLTGQITIRNNSPFSRFGFGDQLRQDMVSASSWGSLSAVNGTSANINLNNPASLGFLRFTAFEIAVNGKTGSLKENSGLGGRSSISNDGNLSYLALAFPITQSWAVEADTLRRAVPVQWGMSIALVPNTSVSYAVQTTNDLMNIGSTTSTFSGSGNTYHVMWSNGVRYKGFALGVNTSYLYGRTSEEIAVDFNDTENSIRFDDLISDINLYRGFLWNAGLQYQHVFNQKEIDANPNKRIQERRLKVGIFGNSSSPINQFNSSSSQRVSASFGVRDTVTTSSEVQNIINLPTKLGVGILYEKAYAYRFGVNYEMANWSSFSSSTTNTFRVAAGGEWIPDYTANRKPLKQLQYRFGIFYESDNRLIFSSVENKDVQLRKYGITFGFGIPIRLRNKPSFVNLGLEFGQFGHPSIINENYLKVNLGFTLNDSQWFVRPKFR